MENINHNNRNSISYKNECCLADEIFRNLNQGSLFEIYQLIEKLNGQDEEKFLEQVFLEKYHFDFRQYI